MTDRALRLIKPEHLDPAGLQVINPADGSHITIPALTAIIEQADAARHEWAARTAKERSDMLRAW
jgi:succinate-semialdehyde dehydrogenase/glutarate-semialdehyde dehydrogenase